MRAYKEDGSTLIDHIYENYRNISVTITYGLFSAILGLIKLNTPGFEGSYSDLREVALIVSLFHLRKPIYIIPLCLITLIGIPFDLKIIAVFVMHAIPLIVIWYLYGWLRTRNMRSIHLAVLWNLVVFIYFTVLLYPILIISYQLLGYNQEVGFMESYISIFKSGLIEMITTCFISGLYLLQLNMRRKLQFTNRYLEEIVKERTAQLSEANEELLNLNENLEFNIQERTKKINEQLKKITSYAHMNSHEVRAPLARILGLVSLVKTESDSAVIEDLMLKIEQSAEELDQIVRKMNELLGPEEDTAKNK